jgi:hypothetical protein
MAFRGVTLGQSISLGQAQFTDRPQDGLGNTHDASSAHREIVDDWSQVSLDEIERDCIIFLDTIGFRYYIPAFMLSVLNHYHSSSTRVIGTLACLYPKKDNRWEYAMNRCFSLQLRTEHSHRTIPCRTP